VVVVVFAGRVEVAEECVLGIGTDDGPNDGGNAGPDADVDANTDPDEP
jgi:hypothetical protein